MSSVAASRVTTEFNALAQSLGMLPDQSSKWLTRLHTQLCEPHRAYHTHYHLYEMFKQADGHDLSPANVQFMRAFILFHDYFYETTPLERYAENEKRSADIAIAFLTEAGADAAFITRVSEAIIASKTHEIDVKRDPVAALALDIDMAILAAGPGRYITYLRQVREEFKVYSDDMFYNARRNQFLEPTLKKTRIFKTDNMHARYDKAARRNMRLEIQSIKSGQPKQKRLCASVGNRRTLAR